MEREEFVPIKVLMWPKCALELPSSLMNLKYSLCIPMTSILLYCCGRHLNCKDNFHPSFLILVSHLSSVLEVTVSFTFIFTAWNLSGSITVAWNINAAANKKQLKVNREAGSVTFLKTVWNKWNGIAHINTMFSLFQWPFLINPLENGQMCYVNHILSRCRSQKQDYLETSNVCRCTGKSVDKFC